jgi:sec-independent protein translocase protein TatA
MEIVLLLVLALFLFGAKRLPEIGRSLGSSMREFKDAVTGRGDEPAPPAALPPVGIASRAPDVARDHDAV